MPFFFSPGSSPRPPANRQHPVTSVPAGQQTSSQWDGVIGWYDPWSEGETSSAYVDT